MHIIFSTPDSDLFNQSESSKPWFKIKKNYERIVSKILANNTY